MRSPRNAPVCIAIRLGIYSSQVLRCASRRGAELIQCLPEDPPRTRKMSTCARMLRRYRAEHSELLGDLYGCWPSRVAAESRSVYQRSCGRLGLRVPWFSAYLSPLARNVHARALTTNRGPSPHWSRTTSQRRRRLSLSQTPDLQGVLSVLTEARNARSCFPNRSQDQPFTPAKHQLTRLSKTPTLQVNLSAYSYPSGLAVSGSGPPTGASSGSSERD